MIQPDDNILTTANMPGLEDDLRSAFDAAKAKEIKQTVDKAAGSSNEVYYDDKALQRDTALRQRPKVLERLAEISLAGMTVSEVWECEDEIRCYMRPALYFMRREALTLDIERFEVSFQSLVDEVLKQSVHEIVYSFFSDISSDVSPLLAQEEQRRRAQKQADEKKVNEVTTSVVASEDDGDADVITADQFDTFMDYCVNKHPEYVNDVNLREKARRADVIKLRKLKEEDEEE